MNKKILEINLQEKINSFSRKMMCNCEIAKSVLVVYYNHICFLRDTTEDNFMCMQKFAIWEKKSR